MASSYEFIIAGLPQLALDFEQRSFSLQETVQALRPMLGKSDNRLLDWLLFGMEGNHLSSHFYRRARRCNDSFLRGYFAFDWELRNITAAYTARQYGLSIKDQLCGSGELVETLQESKAEDFDLKHISEYSAVLHKIMQINDPLDREQQLDKLRWEKATELSTFHYFDIDVLLAFVLKASLVSRWAQLNKETGARLFKELVQEVKGTYKA